MPATGRTGQPLLLQRENIGISIPCLRAWDSIEPSAASATSHVIFRKSSEQAGRRGSSTRLLLPCWTESAPRQGATEGLYSSVACPVGHDGEPAELTGGAQECPVQARSSPGGDSALVSPCSSSLLAAAVSGRFPDRWELTTRSTNMRTDVCMSGPPCWRAAAGANGSRLGAQ